MAGGARIPGGRGAELFVHAIHGDGHDWQGSAPTCSTPALAPVALTEVASSTWRVGLSEDLGLADTRLRCTLGHAAEVSLRVPTHDQVPVGLELRLWPQELSSDYPLAEFHAVLLDARGERAPVEGVDVWADRGMVRVEDVSGTVLHGEYDGRAAIALGQDVLHARYALPTAPVGADRVVAALLVTHEALPERGTVTVHARALGPRGLPIPGVPIRITASGAPELAADGAAVRIVTAPDGWASAAVEIPEGTNPVMIQAESEFRLARVLALRGQAGVGPAPGGADLRADQTITVLAGRTHALDVLVDPEVLYTGTRAVATIRVFGRDRAGTLLTQAPDSILVSQGRVGPWRSHPEGGFVANTPLHLAISPG
jgi:hypothetical protein